MNALTRNQRTVLELMRHQPRIVKGIVDASWSRSRDTGHFSWDQVHSILRRLEDRGLARRAATRPTLWELTTAGRKELGA